MPPPLNLDKAAFVRGDRSISYRIFSRDIAQVIGVFKSQVPIESQIIALSHQYGAYLHWVIHFACVVMGLATVQLRAHQQPRPDWLLVQPHKSVADNSVVVNHRLLGRGEEQVSGYALNVARAALTRNPTNLNRLILTSGTTGTPKAVPLTNEVLLKRILFTTARDQLSTDDKVLVLFGRDTAGGFQSPYNALYRGATVLLESPSTVEESELYAAINRSTRLSLTPSMLHSVVTSTRGFMFKDKQTRIVTTTGSRVEPNTVALALETLCAEVRSIYGSTEVSGVALASLRDISTSPHFAGYISQDVELNVVAEDGRVLPAGETGIVAIRTPCMVEGYWQAETPNIFRDGWFYPGDTGYVLADGRLFIDGRVDDRLIFRGEKFSAPAMESELRELARVDDAFVTVVSDHGEDWFIVMIAGDGADESIRADIRPAVRGWPFKLVIAENIPRNHMGKLERQRVTDYCRDLLGL